MRLDLAEIVRCLGCARDVKVTDGSVTVTSVVTDSREAVAGSLFVCIAGERVDGHDYAARAVEQGAVAVLASRPLEGLSVPVLLVQDTVRALGAVAALWRGKSSARVVGITGSAGKTTVKELLAHVLSRRGKTACNALNLNNQVGMPLCMLKTDGDEDFWVFEAGISHEGDMDELGAILQPDLALILNVGAAHTEGLGERGVAWHKSRLLAHLAPEGQALVSADYDDLVREARAVFGDVLFFTASGRPLSYRAAYAGCSDGVHGQYRLWLDGRPCDVIAPFRGDYGTENCIAVAAAAHMLGLTAEEIAAGFADAQLPPQRFARSRRGNWDIVDDTYNANPLSMARMLDAVAAAAHMLGLTAEEIAAGFADAQLPPQRFARSRRGNWDIVDDTYNANPLSMARMLDAAAESAQKRPFVVVLGEMRELGSVADREHERLGRHLAQLRPVLVFWRGGHADAVRDGLEHGLYTGKFLPVDSGEAFVQALREHLPAETGEQGGLMLFKGSRGNHLEELLEALEQSDWLPGSRTESL